MQTARRQMRDALTPSFSKVLSPPRLLLVCLWIWATSGHRLLGRRKSPKSVGFLSPYSACPHSQSCAGWGGWGLRRLAPAGARRGAVRHCAAEAQWRLVYHVRGEQKAWQSSAYNEVFSVMGRRESSCFPNHFPKEILTLGLFYVFCLVFGATVEL